MRVTKHFHSIHVLPVFFFFCCVFFFLVVISAFLYSILRDKKPAAVSRGALDYTAFNSDTYYYCRYSRFRCFMSHRRRGVNNNSLTINNNVNLSILRIDCYGYKKLV